MIVTCWVKTYNHFLLGLVFTHLCSFVYEVVTVNYIYNPHHCHVTCESRRSSYIFLVIPSFVWYISFFVLLDFIYYYYSFFEKIDCQIFKPIEDCYFLVLLRYKSVIKRTERMLCLNSEEFLIHTILFNNKTSFKHLICTIHVVLLFIYILNSCINFWVMPCIEVDLLSLWLPLVMFLVWL